ncbi:MAG: SIS domain-containing protein [Alphaproteobacteria bacterium]
MENGLFDRYFASLRTLSGSLEATDAAGAAMTMEAAGHWAATTARATHAAGRKIMFIGNGGSAGIASHLAIDYSKNGGMRSLAFNDPAALTCLANDLGYEQVFAKQIDLHAVEGDLLFAISSSGRSVNILRAVETARDRGCRVMTLSGFSPDNPLRRLGHVNAYVASDQYGFVEIMHMTILHAALDVAMGWNGAVMG